MAATGVFRPIADYRDMIQMLHRDLTTRVGEPVFISEMIASAYAALISSLAITTAIFERNTSGIGQAVEMPLYDAMLQAVGVLAMIRPPFRAITKSIFSGFDHQYQCLDGRWVHIVATVPRHAEAFLNAVNRRDLIEKDANGFYPKDANGFIQKTLMAFIQKTLMAFIQKTLMAFIQKTLMALFKRR